MDGKAVKATLVVLGIFAMVCGSAAVAPFALLHWNDTWGRWSRFPHELAAAQDWTPSALHDPLVRGIVWNRAHGVPGHDLTPEQWAEGDLVHWLSHPHQLDARAERIGLVGQVVLEDVGEHDTYYVFTFHGPPGHWAGAAPMVGVSGPWSDAGARWPSTPWSELAGGGLDEAAAIAITRHGESYGEVASGWLVSP